MEFVRWFGTLVLGAGIGIEAINIYDEHHPRGRSPDMTAAIIDSAIHLGWECARDGTMTLDGCRRLAAGVQQIGD